MQQWHAPSWPCLPKFLNPNLETPPKGLSAAAPTTLALRAPPALTAAALACGFADLNQVCPILFRRCRIYTANTQHRFLLKDYQIYTANPACQPEKKVADPPPPPRATRPHRCRAGLRLCGPQSGVSHSIQAFSDLQREQQTRRPFLAQILLDLFREHCVSI